MTIRFNHLARGLALAGVWMIGQTGYAEEKSGVHWPSFRGPAASGVAEGFPMPTTWNVETSEHIKWKTPIPGLAHSSPVVWGDHVFVTTAVSSDPDPYLRVGLYGASPDHPEDLVHEYRLYCLDKSSGEILWERTAHSGKPKLKRHIKATHADSTPATDGKHVLAYFGSEGLYCYDLDGKQLWKKDLGFVDAGPFDAAEVQWGVASSPIIYQDAVVMQVDARNMKFVAVYDVADGKQRWLTRRNDVPTWSTPAVFAAGGRTQVVVNGYEHLGGYDFATGKELWRIGGGGDVPVPTPIMAHGLIYLTGAHGLRKPIYALKPTATGTIANTDGDSKSEHLAWSYARRGIYMQTPIVYDDYLYACRNNGMLTCFDARSGKRQFLHRLGKGRTGFSASAVAGDGKLYFTSEEGDIYVMKAGAKAEQLAHNTMGEICMATPAISEGMLLVRGKDHLFCISE